MALEPIKNILMRRDQITAQEADEIIEEAKSALADMIATDTGDPFNICEEYFGLEPDYIDQIM